MLPRASILSPFKVANLPCKLTPSAIRYKRTKTPVDPSTLPKRSVVGSVLLQYDAPSKRAKVALFKRSESVKSYAGKYGIISGGIESSDESPYDAALREIHEETGLYPDELRYLCAGKEYSLIDQRAGYLWNVHPFAFYLSRQAESRIRLGFDHDGFKWFDPRELVHASYLAAGIEETVKRVWPAAACNSSINDETLVKYLLKIPGFQTLETARDALVGGAWKSSATTMEQWAKSLVITTWHIANNSPEKLAGEFLVRAVPVVMANKLDEKRPGDSVIKDDIMAHMSKVAEFERNIAEAFKAAPEDLLTPEAARALLDQDRLVENHWKSRVEVATKRLPMVGERRPGLKEIEGTTK